MENKNKLRFYVKDIKSLEFVEIRKVLQEHHHRCYKINMRQGVEKLMDKFLILKDKYEMVFIGWQMGRSAGKIELLDKNKNSEVSYPPGCNIIRKLADKSMLEQVLSLLNLQPTKEQKLIIANAKRGITGLHRMMARKSEIEDIRNREMVARGLSQKDYDSVQEDYEHEIIVKGLCIVSVAKAEYKDLVLDHVFWESYGKPKIMDVLIIYRDGLGMEYVGSDYMAYNLFEEFRGLYDGANEWHGYDSETEKVINYLIHEYEK